MFTWSAQRNVECSNLFQNLPSNFFSSIHGLFNQGFLSWTSLSVSLLIFLLSSFLASLALLGEIPTSSLLASKGLLQPNTILSILLCWSGLG